MFDVRFLPNPHYEHDAATADRATTQRVVEFINRDGELDAFYDQAAPAARLPAPAVPRRGQGASGGRDRLHRRPPPIGRDRRAPGGALRVACHGVPRRGRPPRRGAAGVIDHVGFEVSDLARSARVLRRRVPYALGGRRMIDSEHAIAYGVNGPALWIVVRGRPPAPGYGHVALEASGKAAVDAAYNGRARERRPRRRPAGATAAVRPRGTTRPTCSTPTGCGSRSSRGGRRRRWGRPAGPSVARLSRADGESLPVGVCFCSR